LEIRHTACRKKNGNLFLRQLSNGNLQKRDSKTTLSHRRGSPNSLVPAAWHEGANHNIGLGVRLSVAFIVSRTSN
jgi:hypothetical protein